MTIDLYLNLSENNKLGKTLQSVATLTGELRDVCSIQNPVILIEADELSYMNYLYIKEFDRYYFVNDITAVRKGLWQISCHVDVLESFADDIKEQTAIISRQENLYNLYQTDDMFKTYSRPVLDEIAFKNDFSHWSYFIALAGAID